MVIPAAADGLYMTSLVVLHADGRTEELRDDHAASRQLKGRVIRARGGFTPKMFMNIVLPCLLAPQSTTRGNLITRPHAQR